MTRELISKKTGTVFLIRPSLLLIMVSLLLELGRDLSKPPAPLYVAAFVSPDSKHAEAVAEHFWQLHNQPKGSWTSEVKYVPSH
jgi:hypothetical protein